MRLVEKIASTYRLFGEVWGFLRSRKKFWLLPMLLVLLAFGTLLFLTQGSILAPFIYALF
jgi:hypothetical protein